MEEAVTESIIRQANQIYSQMYEQHVRGNGLEDTTNGCQQL
jgi:hypothetical protein